MGVVFSFLELFSPIEFKDFCAKKHFFKNKVFLKWTSWICEIALVSQFGLVNRSGYKLVLEFKFSWNEKIAYSILILQINSAWRTELFVKKYRTWCNSSKNIVTFNRELWGSENRKVYLNVSNPNVFLNGYIQVADI